MQTSKISNFEIMSTLINVINNVDSEIENLSWRKKFRFHNRKLLKFGIFEHKTSIVSSRGNLTLFHIICDSEIELKTHYFIISKMHLYCIVLYCIVLGVALTRPLYSTGGVIVRSVLKVVIISL